jgi:acyl-CoA synthetase (AMP-forming)/AMP-acid ligase II
VPFGSLFDRFAEHAAARPDQLALDDGELALTWAEMADRVERIAARLQADGLERGQAVALIGTSDTRFALAFLAAIRAGGCAAPLTASAAPEQLAAMAADTGAMHLFLDPAKAAELDGQQFPELTRVHLDAELDAWMAPPGTRAAAHVPEEADPACIIYSSGTTGVPKGIVQSHAMRWRNVFGRMKGLFDPAARTLISTPLYSNTTLAAFVPTVFTGGTVLLMRKFDALGWLQRAQNERATHTMLVPVQYQRLLAHPQFDSFDLSAMKLKLCTSAPFAAELKQDATRRFPGVLLEIYGMTEGGAAAQLDVRAHPDKLHTVGKTVPGSEFRTISAEGEVLPEGEVGELIGRSSTMMSGYRNRPDLTEAGYWYDPADGSRWQRTDDLGRIDEDGFIELVGRSKDMINSGGFNIYPIDLETALLRDPRVAEAAVVGAPSEQWGETPVAFVVLQPGADPAAGEDIRSEANARLGRTQRISALHVIAEMPRNQIGKVMRSELRELL